MKDRILLGKKSIKTSLKIVSLMKKIFLRKTKIKNVDIDSS